ncbi:MAG: nickel-dependent hydrogenase large subunit [Azonexus sp.]|nr:nickel-dependent hydrogenase large subunit [Azonexus sp.]
MTAIQSLAALTGELRLTPGAPLPGNLASTRPALAPRLSPGRSASELPALLAALFSLCGEAHRLCAQLAIAAAAPELPPPAMPALSERLRRETALEHVRRIGLDWPRLLDASAAQAAAESLRRCPLSSRRGGDGDDWLALRGWIASDLLRFPGDAWLAAWDAQGAAWLRDWSQRGDGWLAAMLRLAREADDPTPVAPTLALRPPAPDTADEWRQFGAALEATPQLALQPRWRGVCAHTGSWSRRRNPANPPPLTAWATLGARIAELIRLSQPAQSEATATTPLLLGGRDDHIQTAGAATPAGQGAALLSCGALATGPRRGLAWVEMARGLLLHQVTVDGAGEAATVRACQVVAPSEWNFHPEGVVAQALARLPPACPADEALRRVHLLIAAFDPCLPFTVARAEASHA